MRSSCGNGCWAWLSPQLSKPSADSDAVQVEEQVECIICGSMLSLQTLQNSHFSDCFEAHCPVTGPPATVQPRNSTVHGVQMGSFNIPACAAELLFTNSLCPLTRIELAQTSRQLQSVVGTTWPLCVQMLWSGLWKHTPGGEPDGECGCIFEPPATTSSRGNIMNALKLWRAQTLLSVDIHYKCVNGKVVEYMLDKGSESHVWDVPVLLCTSVMDLKWHVISKEGLSVDQLRVRLPTGRQLLHSRAPLGAYVWDLLAPVDLSSGGCQAGQRSGMIQTLKFDIMLKMSTRSCNDLA